MKIILVRHGESESNIGININKDTSLTPRGKKQVEYLALRLKDYNISEIYSSNLIRAKETAEIISKKINVKIRGYFLELNEYSSEYLKSGLIRILSLRLKKLRRLLKNVSKNKEKDKTVLFVTHGVLNRIIIAYLLNLKLNKKLLRFKQDNACLNFLSWDEKYKNWDLWSMNDLEHLPRSLRNSQEINFLRIGK